MSEDTYTAEYSHGTLWFTGDINDESAHLLVKLIHQVEQEKATQDDKYTELRLQSNGGSVHAALRIHDAIKRSPLPITVIAEGWVASSAVLLLCAAERVLITQNSFLLVHELQTEYDCPYSNTFRYQEHLRVLMESIVIILNSRFKDSIAAKDIEKDWFMDAEEAKICGLADEVI
jgi:ATP-dependent Clp protease protease subunit